MTPLRRPGLLPAFCALGFVALGLPDGVLGVAWPSMRSGFGLPVGALGALLGVSTAGYVASSFASGRLLARMTVGTLLGLSCATTALGLLGYAMADSWRAVVALGLLAGLGAGAIDAGINTYVASHHSARTLGLMHAAYGLGTTAGPLGMTALLMAGPGWRAGYALLGAAQLLLALLFIGSRGLWPAAAATAGAGAVEARDAPGLASTLRQPTVQLGAGAFFLYVGLEASAGAWIFTLLADARGGSMEGAGSAASGFWAGLMLGRLALAVSPACLDPSRLLGSCTLGLAATAGLLAVDLGSVANALAIVAFGVAAGPVFPLLIATTPRRVGSARTADAVGFQVAASALGQSLVPAGIGVAAGALGLESIARGMALAALLLVVVERWLAHATRRRERAESELRDAPPPAVVQVRRSIPSR